MATKLASPRISASNLAKLMSGSCDCPFSAWFASHHKLASQPMSSSLLAWKMDHTGMLLDFDEEIAERTFTVRREWWFEVPIGPQGIIVAGKIDRLLLDAGWFGVVDCKAARPQDAHLTQVMLYMALLPRLPEFSKLTPYGAIFYTGRERINLTPGDFPPNFDTKIERFVSLLAGLRPLGKAPGTACRFCPLSTAECPERIEHQRAA